MKKPLDVAQSAQDSPPAQPGPVKQNLEPPQSVPAPPRPKGPAVFDHDHLYLPADGPLWENPLNDF